MSTVKTKVVRIGNSRGIRIPKVILDQYDINEEVELETKEDCLVIKSPHTAREGWDLAFQEMHENQEDVFNPLLKTHKLKGELKGSWACSVSYELRIIFKFVEYKDQEAILLETIGSHEEVY